MSGSDFHRLVFDVGIWFLFVPGSPSKEKERAKCRGTKSGEVFGAKFNSRAFKLIIWSW